MDADGVTANGITSFPKTQTSGTHGNYTFVPKNEISLEPTIVNAFGNYDSANYQLSSPTHIAYDNNKETLYIANTSNNEIISINLSTSRPTSFGITVEIPSTDITSPTALVYKEYTAYGQPASTATGYLYFLDNYRTLKVFNLTTKVLSTIYTLDSDVTGTDIVFDSNDYEYNLSSFMDSDIYISATSWNGNTANMIMQNLLLGM